MFRSVKISIRNVFWVQGRGNYDDIYINGCIESLGIHRTCKKTCELTNACKILLVFMALGINQVTYSNRQFCRSVDPGFATLGTSR